MGVFRSCIAAAAIAALSGGAAWAEQRPDARKVELDRLLQSLKSAPDESTAAMIEGRIRTLWVKQGSPAAVLLMARGDRDLQGGAEHEALDDYEAALTLEPDYAEGFNRRAAARAALGDFPGALADIGEVLKREPRHFSALQGLSHIAEQRGDWQGALEAWRKAMEIDPHTPGGAARLEMLRKRVEGEAA